MTDALQTQASEGRVLAYQFEGLRFDCGSVPGFVEATQHVFEHYYGQDMMTDSLECFKAYDVRGRIPDQLNEDIARRIGQAYAEVIQPSTVVVGHDIRLTSESIKAALIDGLLDTGGLGAGHWPVRHGGDLFCHRLTWVWVAGLWSRPAIIPKDYNGMKFVREGSKPYLRRLGSGGHSCHWRSAMPLPQPVRWAGSVHVDTEAAYR